MEVRRDGLDGGIAPEAGFCRMAPPGGRNMKAVLASLNASHKGAMEFLDPRDVDRYLVHWKIGLVYDKGERRPRYLGRTYDLSLNGTGILTDANVFSASPVVILLAPPPLYKGHRPRIIEVAARQLYCIYSGEKGCFNLGFEFKDFKDGGIEMLRERLKSHRSLRTNELITQIALARYVSA